MTKTTPRRRRGRPTPGLLPPFPIDTSTWGAGIPYERLRPLLIQADDDELAAVCDAYDAAWRHGAEQLEQRPPAAFEVEAAYRAEQAVAAAERRPATMSWSAVQAAQAAEADHLSAVAASNIELGRRNHALAAAIREPAAVGSLLHVIANERARMLMAGDDPGDPAPGRNPLRTLYTAFPWPRLAYGPGLVHQKRRLGVWWPLVLGGPLEVVSRGVGQRGDERVQWNEWAWQQLTRRDRGYRIESDGRLQFLEAWRPPTPRPPRGFEPGAVVMVGIGPNGEQGATGDDVRGQTLKGLRWG